MSTTDPSPRKPLRVAQPLRTGRHGDRRPAPLLFLILLWVSLLIAFGVLATLLVTILLEGWGKLSLQLFTNYPSATPDPPVAQPAILVSAWVFADRQSAVSGT